MKASMSRVSLNILSETEKEVLLSLKPFFEQNGLLSGGTALMLQRPLRKSYDFDLFFPFEITESFLKKTSKVFNSKIEVLINNPDEMTFIALEQIKVSLIFFPYKRKHEPIIINDYIVLSSFKDIASDKAYVIGRRPEYRDYVDLFIILKNDFTLKQTILDAKEKFGGEFSEKLFLSQLLYFEDLKDFTVELIGERYSVDEVRSFFNKLLLGKTLFNNT